MNTRKKVLICMLAAMSGAFSLLGSYSKQVYTYYGYATDTFSTTAPAGANVFWETQCWGYAAASLNASGPGISISSYCSGYGHDYGSQTTTALGTVSGSMSAESYSPSSSFAIALIEIGW